MKLKTLLFTLALTSFIFSSNAQNEEGQNVATGGVGYSLAIDFIKSSLDIYEDVSTSSTPAIAFTFDRGITDRFSLGLAFSIQTLTADFANSYLDANQNTVNEIATTSVARSNIALRPLLHYGGNESLDLYSGLRVGLTSLSASYETNDPDLDVDDLNASRVSVGLVLFGMRYYFTDNIGMNFDVQLGAPYILSAGIAGKF